MKNYDKVPLRGNVHRALAAGIVSFGLASAAPSKANTSTPKTPVGEARIHNLLRGKHIDFEHQVRWNTGGPQTHSEHNTDVAIKQNGKENYFRFVQTGCKLSTLVLKKIPSSEIISVYSSPLFPDRQVVGKTETVTTNDNIMLVHCEPYVKATITFDNFRTHDVTRENILTPVGVTKTVGTSGVG